MSKSKLSNILLNSARVISVASLFYGAGACLEMNKKNQELSKEIKYNNKTGYMVEAPADLILPQAKDYLPAAAMALGVSGLFLTYKRKKD